MLVISCSPASHSSRTSFHVSQAFGHVLAEHRDPVVLPPKAVAAVMHACRSTERVVFSLLVRRPSTIVPTHGVKPRRSDKVVVRLGHLCFSDEEPQPVWVGRAGNLASGARAQAHGLHSVRVRYDAWLVRIPIRTSVESRPHLEYSTYSTISL